LYKNIYDKETDQINNSMKQLLAYKYRIYPTEDQQVLLSKTCSSCDHKLEKLDLGTREWTCPNCGTHHDRDINAAKNILRVGQLDCYGEAMKSQATGDLENSIGPTEND